MNKKVSADGTAYIVPSLGSGDTIDGLVELVHSVQFQSTTLVSDGLDLWLVID
ncbi:MAG: hypothetical protein GF341_06695 [candidate division Zixibacteria bacterium]|nr:hypothetical protein [candidate division Zixibacteria bacterium]